MARDGLAENSLLEEVERLRREVTHLQQRLADRDRSRDAPPQATRERLAQLAIALEHDEEFIRALLQNLSEGIVACDASGTLTLYNAAARKWLSLPEIPTPELTWTTHCTLMNAQGSAPLSPEQDPLWRALHGESVEDFELIIQPVDGEPRTVLVNGDPIRTVEGTSLGAVIALRDITAFRRTMATLQDREAFLRSIYDGLEISIFVVDVLSPDTFRYAGINPAHSRWLGMTSEALQGKSPAEVLPADLATQVMARYRECVTSQLPLSYEEFLPFQDQQGWWLTTLQPLFNAQGEVWRLIGTSINITRRRQAEERLQALNDELERRVVDRTQELTHLNAMLLQTTAMLERRNQELDQFVYVASHDLKAPLRAIANLSSWLEEDLGTQLPEENQAQLRLMRGRVQRMEGLINGLLEYSRVGRKDFPLEVVGLSDLLAEIIDSLGPPDSFVIDLPPNLPTILTKRLLLQQVFANLISNAIKYCDRDDGHIQIHYQDLGHAYQFAVADNGPGIAPRYHEKIFGVFQILQARDQIESTGIGLSIVKKILDTEGGTIHLESDLGQGTTFHFTWPKYDDTSA